MATVARRGKPKIKPPRKHGPEVSIDETWNQLSTNIREIFNHNVSTLSFEENHRFAYNMVLHKHGEELYEGVKTLIIENLDRLGKNQIIPAFPTGSSKDSGQRTQEGERLLAALRSVWDDHRSSLCKLSDILKYMDRVYTASARVPVIWDAGFFLFHRRIIRPPISNHIISAILEQIRIERDGLAVNRSAVKACVDVLRQLSEGGDSPSVYQRDIEPAVLKESEAFYKLEAEKLINTCDATEYLERVENRFIQEDARAHHYLSSQTAAPLQKILEETLLTPRLVDVLAMENSGLDAMIDWNKISSLSRLYRMFLKVSAGLPALRRSVKESIVQRGKDINLLGVGTGSEMLEPNVDVELDSPKSKTKSKARPTGQQTLTLALRWVQDVLDLKDKFDNVWKSAFNSDRDLESGMNEAFETFINMNPKAPEFISLFIDEHLKKGLKDKTDSEVDMVLDKTITVFRYVADKDIFERYYKEHNILTKLKVECGYQFTQKMEGMFNDMRISADHMREYRDHLAHTTAPAVDINVIVMTSTFWPMSHSASPCNLPEELVKPSKSFEQFYLARHSGRRLTWQPSLGNVDVRTQFKTRTHDLNVSTFAFVILSLFECLADDEFLTYEEIKDATAIYDTDLQRNLQSLACAKFKVLKKHPPGRDVHPGDSFSFNADFSANLQKIKISTVSSKVETTEERKDTQDRINEERRHQTEACIVRVMKNRKHMTHNDLINEVTRQLATRFQPNPLDMKTRIEGLIEREYLERCDDLRSYNYMA